VPFAETGVPFIEKSCRTRRTGARPPPGRAGSAPNPAAPIARRSSPGGAFLWKSRFADAKSLILRPFASAYVSIG
jgi:hypothetical protein